MEYLQQGYPKVPMARAGPQVHACMNKISIQTKKVVLMREKYFLSRPVLLCVNS